MPDAITERRLAAIEAHIDHEKQRWARIDASLTAVEAKLDTLSNEWAATKFSARILIAVGATLGGIATWLVTKVLAAK